VEVKNLEEIWCPKECLHIVDTYKNIMHMRKKERKTNRMEVEFARRGGITGVEAPTSTPPPIGS
jgi:hypothetical protein